MVWVVIAMFFRTVSVSRSLAHYVAVARMVSDPRTDDVRDRLDHPNQQQDSNQHPRSRCGDVPRIAQAAVRFTLALASAPKP
jgi:hypothetical protein